MSHPTSRLDPTIHQPARLGILTVAGEAKRVDFVTLRDLLGLPTATSRATWRRSRPPAT